MRWKRKAQSTHAQRQSAALHIILGLAMLFLAAVLLVTQVQQLHQGPLTLSQIVGFLGVLLFFLLGVMLLVSQIRQTLKRRADARREQGRSNHG